jgi:hypothetical protein
MKERLHTLCYTVLCVCSFLIINGCHKDKSCPTCPSHSIDTTSHVVQWQPPDTLGTYGIIRDVWVFDKNNAWAVGEIYFNDSTGMPDMSQPYNAAHWNGTKWEILKVQFYTFCNQTSSNAYPANCVWGFSPDNFYIASGSQIAKMNGTTQTEIACLPVSISKMWGTNNNLFTAGPLGQLGFFNGINWTKITSNTTCDLQDIWGIDATHIWATGFNDNDGHCVVLQCNGSSWITLYDNNNQPDSTKYQFNTLWTKTASSIYLDGGSWLRIMNLSNLNIGSPIKTGLTYLASRIRGVNQNDIFDVTTGGEVAHYNGSSWHSYPEIQSLGGGNAGWSSVFPKNDFVVISGDFFTGLNGIPVVVRGYR